jgi:hypothetical protein
MTSITISHKRLNYLLTLPELQTPPVGVTMYVGGSVQEQHIVCQGWLGVRREHLIRL